MSYQKPTDASTRGAALIRVFFFLIIFTSFSSTITHGADAVSFNLAWVPQGSTSGVLVAIENGYYEEVNLEVTAVRGYGGNRTINELDQGLFDFAYGNPIGIILNRANGGHTRLIGVINDVWPAGLCYVEQERQPRTIEDLQGLTAIGGAFSPVHELVPIWLEKNGFPRDHINLVRVQPDVIVASLTQGRAELAECWRGSDMPLIKKQAAALGKTVGWLEYRKFNLDIYSNGLATSEQMITEQPEVVRRFVQATYRGYQFLIDHPEEAADIVHGRYPLLDHDVLLGQIEDINELIIGPDLAERGLGWIRADKMARTVELVTEAYDVRDTVQTADIFTNQFLETVDEFSGEDIR